VPTTGKMAVTAGTHLESLFFHVALILLPVPAPRPFPLDRGILIFYESSDRMFLLIRIFLQISVGVYSPPVATKARIT